MKAKKIKIPINNNFLINKRSLSNKAARKNNPIFNKGNSNKKFLNISDNDTSRIDTTTESSIETMKKITIYKKNSTRPKNSINIIRNKINSLNKNKNDRLIHYTSAKDLFKNNNYKTNQSLNNIDLSIDNYLLNGSLKNFNLIRKTEEEKNITRNIYNKFFPSIKEYRNQMKKNDFINIEDLMILEEIFHDIILSIKIKSNICNECFELINFYNHSSLYNKFENYFKDDVSKNIVHISILKMLFCVILLYHYSFNNFLFNNNYEYLYTVINLNYKCFLLLCEYISNKISIKESENIFVKKLRLMLTRNLKHITVDNKEFKIFFSNLDLNISNLNYNLIEIKYYLFLIQKNIKILLKNLINDRFQNDFYILDHTISSISGGEIIKFFRKKIFQIINKNGSVFGNDASFYGGKSNIKNIKIPYLDFKSRKKYTLVLDLDETLISFKIMDNIKNKGILRLRPGLYEFLTAVKNNYELVIFTSATKEYADPLIDAIEKKEKIFDFRLYRHHTIICENEFVKDIARLGRPLNKLIIVDNLPQNFRLQKENGIMIKAFWGEDVYDTALYELGIILNKIANEFYDTRKGINAYKNDILSKVSSCFSRTEIFD